MIAKNAQELSLLSMESQWNVLRTQTYVDQSAEFRHAIERLSKAAQNEIINVVTIFLGTSVGITMTGERFLQLETLKILALGIVAFSISTASGLLMAKLMNLVSKEKINPLIGSAGVSAVPMAARVSQVEGQKADPGNFLLMHAMGPNVAGVIGTAIVAGYFIARLGG